MKTAFLFPGQGAQTIGMGKDIYDKYEEAKKIYEKAEEISGVEIRKICFEGPEEELIKTENAQLAILTTSLAILKILEEKGIKADIATGLSLGEYTALIYGGFISFEDGIKLIQKRGYYMANNLPNEEYSMAAVIGLESKKIEEICEQIRVEGKFVVPANYNCSSQTAISGASDAIELAIEKLKKAGAKRVIKLKTSGPFHTKKLEEASKKLRVELEKIEIKAPDCVVVKNLDGKPYNTNENIKEVLEKHIISPVKFSDSIKYILENSVDTFIEVGPGKTLTSLVRKIDRNVNCINISDVASLESAIELLNS